MDVSWTKQTMDVKTNFVFLKPLINPAYFHPPTHQHQHLNNSVLYEKIISRFVPSVSQRTRDEMKEKIPDPQLTTQLTDLYAPATWEQRAMVWNHFLISAQQTAKHTTEMDVCIFIARKKKALVQNQSIANYISHLRWMAQRLNLPWASSTLIQDLQTAARKTATPGTGAKPILPEDIPAIKRGLDPMTNLAFKLTYTGASRMDDIFRLTPEKLQFTDGKTKPQVMTTFGGQTKTSSLDPHAIRFHGLLPVTTTERSLLKERMKTTPLGQPVFNQQEKRTLTAALKKSGYSAHSIKKGAAVEAMKNSPNIVPLLLKHKSIWDQRFPSTTLRYVGADPQAKISLLNKIGVGDASRHLANIWAPKQ